MKTMIVLTVAAWAWFCFALVAQTRPPAPYQPKIAWDMEAFSQRDIDSYVWKWYQVDKKIPHVIKAVCKVTELEPTKEAPGMFTCTAPVPKIVGWIRVFPTHPQLKEGYSSAPIYIPATLSGNK